MGEDSKIEWTDHTFNPWWGCTKVSPACTHCYAEAWARRYSVGWGASSAPRLRSEAGWREPLKWNAKAAAAGTRARVFCASMADVFEQREGEHGATLDAQRARLWPLIEATPALDWLLLTKRPENILAMVPEAWRRGFPPNVWLGTTVEDQRRADERIPHLLQVPARVRFLSCEPLLGPIRFADVPGFNKTGSAGLDIVRRMWVIVGGESGPGARPMHPAWARSLRDQCTAAGVPFFFKQWGEWAPDDDIDAHGVAHLGYAEEYAEDGGVPAHSWPDAFVRDTLRKLGKPQPPGPIALDTHVYRVSKRAAGRLLDGRTWDEVPDARP